MSGGEHTIPQEDEDGWYDPELPFLQALERDVRRHARHVAVSRQGVHAMREHPKALRQTPHESMRETPVRHRRLGPAGARVARRSLTLFALLSLIGASAFGAGRIFSSSSSSDPSTVRQSKLITLTTGAFGDERWSLRVYTRGGELCRVLVVSETESSRCSAAPGRNELGATSALGPSRRYLFGLAGPAIGSVSVHGVGSATAARVQTRALPVSATKIAHVQIGERWYVVILTRPVGEPDPSLRVQGLDRDGRPIGVAALDCPETSESSRCSH